MIIYNKIWLNNLRIHGQSENAHHSDLITAGELKKIMEHYPVGFYMPGKVIRIGLFLLTVIIVTFSTGLLSLILAGSHIIDNFMWPALLGAGLYIILEVMVKNNNYYRAGVDDALLWLSGLLLTGAFAWFMYDLNHANAHFVAISAFVFILGLLFTLRFADMVMSIVTCAAFLSALFFLWQHLDGFGRATLPFAMICTAAISYAGIRYAAHHAADYYQSCLNASMVCNLLALYVAGNYYVIDRLNQLLGGKSSVFTSHLLINLFFWSWTMLLPFAYILYGLIKKDRMMLRSGLITAVAASVTFRYYYHLIPTEWALSIAGSMLLIAVYGIVRYLKATKHSYSYNNFEGKDDAEHVNLSGLVTGQLTDHLPVAPAEPVSRFGGGSFGGGGSSSSF